LDRLGKCIWLYGLSGAGKSTIAEELLLRWGPEYITLLDGDEVRKNLSYGLGFSKEDRERHALRVAWVAAEIVNHGGFVIAALITPYESTRQKIREIIGKENIIEVYVDTSLEECEKRDPKGLYKKVRAGEIKNFTGISDPFEFPKENPDIVIDTSKYSPGEAVDILMEELWN